MNICGNNSICIFFSSWYLKQWQSFFYYETIKLNPVRKDSYFPNLCMLLFSKLSNLSDCSYSIISHGIFCSQFNQLLWIINNERVSKLLDFFSFYLNFSWKSGKSSSWLYFGSSFTLKTIKSSNPETVLVTSGLQICQHQIDALQDSGHRDFISKSSTNICIHINPLHYRRN